MIAGQIEIQMLADLARLKKDMDEAKGIVGNAANAMASAAEFAKGALIGIASGLTVHAFASWMKSAIDAGDATKEFASKTGVAAKDVAGLQLAFKQGGVESQALTTALGKMGKAAFEDSDAFKTLGAEVVKNKDGSVNLMKTLYSVADATKASGDEVARNAALMGIFGKSALDLVPTLGEGSEGLLKMANMAEKLGLVIGEDTANAADEFNDTVELLGMGMQGVARQAMAQMLPAMNAVAGGMLDAMTSGNALKTASDALATGLKLLYSVFAGGVQILSSFGKVLGGVGAAIVAVMTGDFGAAKRIGSEMMQDIKTDWTATIKNIGSVWDGTAGKTVEAGTKMMKAQKELQTVTKATGDATNKAAAEEAKRAAEIAKLIGKIENSTDAMRMELDAGQKMTAAQKEALDIMSKLQDGTLKLTDAEKARLVTALEAKLATEALSIATADLNKYLAASAAAVTKAGEEQAKQTDTLRQSVVQMQDENAKLGMSERAWMDRMNAVDQARAMDLEWQAANEGGNAALEEQARLLRERAALREQGVVVREAKTAADEWKKTTDSIGDGLTDALLRGFESGKGFMKNFRDVLVNAFKTLVLQPTIKAIMAPIAGGIGSLFGAGNAVAGQSDGGLLSAAGSISSLFGAGGLGGSIMAGLGAWGTGGSIMGSLTAAGSLMGTGTAGGIMSGLGMGLGTLGPIALGLVALSMLDKKSTPHVGGYALADSMGSVTDITAAQGGKQNANTQAAVSALAGAVSKILNDVGGAFGKSPGVSVRGVFESDNNDPSWALFHLLDAAGAKMTGSFDALGTLAADSTTGFDQFARQAGSGTLEALRSIGLPDWALQEFGKLGSAASIDDIARVASEIIDKAKNPDGASSADPLDAPLRSADPSPMWREMADNAKATAAAAQALVEKAATADEQETQTGVMADAFSRSIRLLEQTVERLTAIETRMALQDARTT